MVGIGWAWLLACGGLSTLPAPTVPAGTHRVGSPADEACRDPSEAVRSVTVPALWVDPTEVTQAAFEERLGYAPSFRRGCPTCPVESLTHDEAEAYCTARSRAEGLTPCHTCEGTGPEVRCTPVGSCDGYRLPTADEHEVAARAGAAGATPAGEVRRCMAADPVADQVGWYKANSGGFTQAVGGLAPNELGLHDLAGNVAEWTATEVPGGQVVRGGSWYHNAEHLRSAARMVVPADRRLSWVGFRCVR